MNDFTRALCLPLVLLLSTAPQLALAASDYDILIQRARNGDYQPALTMLQQREQQGRADKRSRYDHMLIASWAGLPKEVLRLYQESAQAPSALPAPVLLSVARAYRDTKDWDNALALYRLGQARFPAEPSFALDEAMTLADTGQTDLAISRAQALAQAKPVSADAHLALSYIYRIKQEPYAALEQADRARSLAPNKLPVIRGHILALQQARMAQAALRTAQEHPVAVSPAEMRELQGDYAAELSNLASMPTRSREERFDIADKALARYENELAQWQPSDAQHAILRARIDRMQALEARSRMQDTINEYEQLIAEGITPPDYILNEVAAAYLYLRQPDKSRDLLQRALDSKIAQPEKIEQINDQTSLYYSMIEDERFNEASKLITDAQASQATWLSVKGVTEKVPNDAHLILEQTAAIGKQYANDLAGADKRLSAMVALAPRDVNQRVALAQIHRERTWPQLAERELKMAETLQPGNHELIAEQGQTALELQEWKQAEILKDTTQARYPEAVSSKRLARDWEVHQKSELRVTGYLNNTSNSPVSGNGDFGIDTVLYSPPIDYNWRGFAGGGYARGNFEEGRSTYRWMRGGVEWRGRDLTAEAEVSANNYGFGTKTGARLSAAYDLNDHWQVGASAAFRSHETPLRALANNIYSNKLAVFARWQANEGREWTFSVSPSRFSDGNNRVEMQINGRERVYSSPRVAVDLHLDVGASRNTLEDAPYFNPRSDLTVVPSVSLTHTIYRHYDTSLEQTFTLGGGTYTQQGYGTGAIGLLGYGLRYRFNKVVDVGISVTGVSRPYDGVRERDLNVMANINFRF